MSPTSTIDQVHIGFYGEFPRNVLNGQRQPSKARKFDGSVKDSETTLAGKGDLYDFSTADGWRVVAFGPRAHAIESVFDLIKASLTISEGGVGYADGAPQTRRAICRETLPGCAIVAQHVSGSIVLFRDLAGFVPVYYALDGESVRISSNIKAVLHRNARNPVNVDKFSDMLLYGQRTGARTVWEEVRTVQPGSCVLIPATGAPITRWYFSTDNAFDPDVQAELAKLPDDAALRRVGECLDKALDNFSNVETLNVPCGGGVDSSLLGAYLKKRGHKVVYWCINQPDAPRTEREWMDPLSKAMGIPCVYADLAKQDFIENLVETICSTQQPLTGPNAVGGVFARKMALAEGYQHYVSGEFCDTIFGGLSPNGRLWWPIRFIRLLSRLPYRIRMQLIRGLMGDAYWFVDSMQVDTCDDAAKVGFGHLHVAEKLVELEDIARARIGSSDKLQLKSQQLAWLQMRDVASGLNHLFYEKDESLGGTTFYPFVYPEILELGLNLPFKAKVRSGTKKWLWRRFASDYIGHDVAFRKKYGFPTLTSAWLTSAGDLMQHGFVESATGSHAGTIYDSLDNNHSARWTLLNIELWGRLCVWHQDPGEIKERMLRN